MEKNIIKLDILKIYNFYLKFIIKLLSHIKINFMLFIKSKVTRTVCSNKKYKKKTS